MIRTSEDIQIREVGAAPFAAERLEIVGLASLAKLTGAPYREMLLDATPYDIYAHRNVARPFRLGLADLTNAQVVPASGWKVRCKRFYAESVGYTQKSGLFGGLETWPDFGARWAIRVNVPVLTYDSGGATPFLFGGDPAYYHYLLNWLPRLRALELMKDTRRRLQFLVTDRIPVEWLEFFSILVDLPRYEIVRLPENAVWHFPRLLTPGFFPTEEVTPAVADWYRDRLGLKGRKKGENRYYISRSDSRNNGEPRRKVVNEEEVISALAGEGFEPLVLTGRSVRDQVELFSKAEFVVAPHGAGFANMVFSPRGTAAIVLENEFAHQFMAEMLTAAGHQSRILMCRDQVNAEFEAAFANAGVSETEIRRCRDMIVDVPQLLAAVRSMS